MTLFKMRCLQQSCIPSIILHSSIRKYSNSVRVRFAPSPTGRIHLGGLRTALYNFLFARATGGKFVIRIEDTDQARLVPGAAEAIEKDLLWTGIKADESPSEGGKYGPYIQSQRLNHYKYYRQILSNETDNLIESGAAYRCFCTDKRLELLRRDAARRGAVPRYDNRCRELSLSEISQNLEKGVPFCVRFKLEKGPDSFEDMIYGKIVLDTASIEGDPVILKSDGFPTYHLACVVDDHLMQISHVLRGLEWQISTSKHLQLYRAFGWKPPQFGHLPLLMNPNGTKLSKRQGDIDVEHFRKTGVFPEVLLSFVTEFGGGFTRERGITSIYNIEDLVKQFNLQSLNTSSCKVDLERLVRMNRMELERKLKDPKSLTILCNQLRDLVLQHHGDQVESSSPAVSDKRLTYLLQWGLPRMSRIEDFFSPDLNYIWSKPSFSVLLEVAKDSSSSLSNILEEVSSVMMKLSDGEKVNIVPAVKDVCRSHNTNYKLAMKGLRAALSGLKAGPPVGEIIENLGIEESICRLQLAAEALKNQSK
ncbi:putative glutamate--tRNA ligase, mitochondrial [Frankliniella fusca]|uniref:Nondiscriminating glutamyl-tRNA synthetase EARS2, mitochondrial n=1 Tax=Frankliniella fusca TaxID=407009 RepID=A0AAE1HSA2_9NEOP|nr:putative glutamate--tRNA ligase, mitochondrial [Frankliniella fusca]